MSTLALLCFVGWCSALLAAKALPPQPDCGGLPFSTYARAFPIEGSYVSSVLLPGGKRCAYQTGNLSITDSPSGDRYYQMTGPGPAGPTTGPEQLLCGFNCELGKLALFVVLTRHAALSGMPCGGYMAQGLVGGCFTATKAFAAFDLTNACELTFESVNPISPLTYNLTYYRWGDLGHTEPTDPCRDALYAGVNVTTVSLSADTTVFTMRAGFSLPFDPRLGVANGAYLGYSVQIQVLLGQEFIIVSGYKSPSDQCTEFYGLAPPPSS